MIAGFCGLGYLACGLYVLVVFLVSRLLLGVGVGLPVLARVIW